MDNVEKLQKRGAELARKITEKQDALSLALLEGKDTGKMIDEISKLQTEAEAVTAALALAGRLAGEENAAAARAAAENARKEIKEQCEKADSTLIDMLDTLLTVKALIVEYRAATNRVTQLAAQHKAADAVRYQYPYGIFVSYCLGAIRNIALGVRMAGINPLLHDSAFFRRYYGRFDD